MNKWVLFGGFMVATTAIACGIAWGLCAMYHVAPDNEAAHEYAGCMGLTFAFFITFPPLLWLTDRQR